MQPIISIFVLLIASITFAEEIELAEIEEMTGGISPEARNAIQQLVKVDQTAQHSKRITGLRRIMENLDSATLKELFEIYTKTTDNLAESGL
uniref:Uncharacterized protein n=1 Tax=Panagrolaimus sp. JU765 TaxID=591449 RepID=A0AC34R588_9BILA